MTDEKDYNDIVNEEYKKYYENILNQMKNQGFSKIKIEAQRVMYENREDLFEKFLDRYNLDDLEIEFTPYKES